METLGKIRARGDSDFTVDDFDSMPYLLAVGKVCLEPVYLLMKADPQPAQEILRFYPIVVEISRAAMEDNVLPLTKPIVGVSGKVYKGLPVLAGTRIIISTFGHHLCVRPPDPHLRRDRWD